MLKIDGDGFGVQATKDGKVMLFVSTPPMHFNRHCYAYTVDPDKADEMAEGIKREAAKARVEAKPDSASS